MTYSSPIYHLPAWQPQAHTTRFPETGTFAVGKFPFLAGVIGLQPDGAVSHGTVVFRWTSDAAGEHQMGVQGIPLTSLVVSMYQLRLPNLGPYLYLDYIPYVGPNALAMTLCGSDVPVTLPGDTLLITDLNKPLAANAPATIYPCDYFAGRSLVYFQASGSARVTFYAADLTDQYYPLDALSPGSKETITPMGTWCAVVSNQTSAAITYTLTVTPILG